MKFNATIAVYKDCIDALAKKVDVYKTVVINNTAKYSEVYAAGENEKAKAELAEAFKKLVNIIVDRHNETVQKLSALQFPDVTYITNDIKLLNGEFPFALTADELMALAEKYAGNYVMLRAIENYRASNNVHEANNVLGAYDLVHIKTAEETAQVYKRFADSALSILYNMYANGSYNETEIEGYANANHCKDMLDVIGDGKELNNTISSTIPEAVKHSFDYLLLDAERFN